MVDEEKTALAKSILREGFALEWQTASIFEGIKCHVRQNTILNRVTSERGNQVSHEVDVIAEFFSPIESATYIVECKGASSDNVLALVESPNYSHSLPRMYYSAERGELHLSSSKTRFMDKLRGPYFCHTGDFFRSNNGKFEKIGKQWESTNLFKGLEQVVNGVEAYIHSIQQTKREQRHSFEVIPLIVTNAAINVVRFVDPKSRVLKLDSPIIEPVPWALYQNPICYQGVSNLACTEWRNDTRSGSTTLDKRLPWIWIVQVGFLDRLLKSEYAASYI